MSARLLARLDGVTRAFPLGDVARIGADPTNEIVIDAPGLAPLHARVLVEGGRRWVEDAGSPAGTWVNGVRIVREPLSHLDVIGLGAALDLIYLSPEPVAP